MRGLKAILFTYAIIVVIALVLGAFIAIGMLGTYLSPWIFLLFAFWPLWGFGWALLLAFIGERWIVGMFDD